MEAELVADVVALLVALLLTLDVAVLDTLLDTVEDTLDVALDVCVLVAVVCVHSRNVPSRYFVIAAFIRATVPAQSWSFCPTIKNPSIVQFAEPCNSAMAPRPVVP